MRAVQHSGASLGVPLAEPRVALSAPSPRADYRAAGFPLQSLTRNAATTLASVYTQTEETTFVRERALR